MSSLNKEWWQIQQGSAVHSLEAKYLCTFNTQFALHRGWIEVELDSVDAGFRSGLFWQKLDLHMRYVAVGDILICVLCVKVKWVQECVCLGGVYMFLNWSVCVCLGVSVGTERTKACSDSISTCRRCHPFRASASSLVPPSGPRHLLSPTVHKTQQMECIHKNTTEYNKSCYIFKAIFIIHIEVLSHFALGHGKMTLMHSLSGILF